MTRRRSRTGWPILRENLESGVAAAQDGVDDADRDDKAAMRGAEATLKALAGALARLP